LRLGPGQAFNLKEGGARAEAEAFFAYLNISN